MKAMVSVEAGGPETLRLIERCDPVAGPGEVVIAIAACGLNYPDVLMIQDLYQRRVERPFSPGIEVAGVVESVGEGVSDLMVGQRVAASVDHGGLAQKVAASAARCIAIPDDMPFDDAAGFLVVYGTSYFALKTCAEMQPGEWVLVLGAAGGVGLAAVELARAMGCKVIAAASSADKAELARQRGADHAIVYPGEGFDRDAAKAFTREVVATSGGGVNAVYDPVGGAYAQAAFRALATEGRYLVVGFTAGIPNIPLNLPLLREARIIGVLWGGYLRRKREEGNRLLGELFELYRQGRIRPTVSARFPLERAHEGLALLASRRATGKVVVTMAGSRLCGGGGRQTVATGVSGEPTAPGK